MPCPRRPILNSLIKSSGAPSKAVVYGNLLHGLLQSSLQEQDFTPEGTQKRLDGMLKREDVRLDVWGAGLNVRDVAQELGDRARPGFERFGGNWVCAKPGVSFAAPERGRKVV
jgi:DNA replication ATP-dependent helicase Dna2